MKRWISATVAVLGLALAIWFLKPSPVEPQLVPVLSGPLSKPIAPQVASDSITSQPAVVSKPDINAYIQQSWPDSAVTRLAMTQLADGWKRAIYQAHDRDSTHRVGTEIVQAVACLMSAAVLQKSRVDSNVMYDRIVAANAKMFAAPDDYQAYLDFNAQLSGRFFPDAGKNPCSFDPAKQPN